MEDINVHEAFGRTAVVPNAYRPRAPIRGRPRG